MVAMSSYRIPTPWPSSDSTVITDAGMETWLLFQQRVDLPEFALAGPVMVRS